MLEYEADKRWGLDKIINCMEGFKNNILQPSLE
jgi:hypothetical protein